jgi:hypothetical protein
VYEQCAVYTFTEFMVGLVYEQCAVYTFTEFMVGLVYAYCCCVVSVVWNVLKRLHIHGETVKTQRIPEMHTRYVPTVSLMVAHSPTVCWIPLIVDNIQYPLFVECQRFKVLERCF